MFKPDKDFTECVKQGRYYLGKEGPRYIQLFLWNTREALAQAIYLDEGEDIPIGACVKGSIYRKEIADRVIYKTDKDKVCELHFVKGVWNIEVIVHECLHFLLWYCLGCLRLCLDEDLSDEEWMCYLFGDLVDAVYRWLSEGD